MATQTNETAEAIRFLMDLWNKAEASGYDPAAVCDAFVKDGKAGVERIVGRAL